MPSRQATLANLADTFGRCLLEHTAREDGRLLIRGKRKRAHLQKIARILDRLARRPDGLTWHQRANRIRKEFSALLRQPKAPGGPSVLSAS